MTDREWDELVSGVVVAACLLGFILLSVIYNGKADHTNQYEYQSEKLGPDGKKWLDKRWNDHLEEKKWKDERENKKKDRELRAKMKREEEQAKAEREKEEKFVNQTDEVLEEIARQKDQVLEKEVRQNDQSLEESQITKKMK